MTNVQVDLASIDVALAAVANDDDRSAIRATVVQAVSQAKVVQQASF